MWGRPNGGKLIRARALADVHYQGGLGEEGERVCGGDGKLMDSLVVQDLVPDMTLFYKQYKSIQPWLQADKPPTDGSELPPPSKRFGIGILTGSVRASSRGALPVQGGPRQARRHVRVHPLRVLLHQLPFVSSSSPLPISFLLSPNPHRSSTQLLVEPGHLPRPRFVPSILTPSPGSKLTLGPRITSYPAVLVSPSRPPPPRALQIPLVS